LPSAGRPLPGRTVTGVDGCARGWVAVTLRANPAPDPGPDPGPSPGKLPPPAGPVVAAIQLAAALDDLDLAPVTGIDMPLGLLPNGWRDADRLAREALGRRRSTVFAIPPRPVLEAPAYPEANQACRDLTGQGVSVQAYNLRGKIAEAEARRRREEAGPGGVRLYEVHPELAFAALSGTGEPLPVSKHTPEGRAVRRALLARVGIRLPPKVARVAEDDLLDAAAVAWSAARIAAGRAVVLTNPAQRADDGTEIAVRY
jgi:predicted RNase H-like nuclease